MTKFEAVQAILDGQAVKVDRAEVLDEHFFLFDGEIVNDLFEVHTEWFMTTGINDWRLL